MSTSGGTGFLLVFEVTSRFLWLQMTLSPSYRMDDGKMVRVRSSRNAQLAVTQYRVLSSSLSAALLELQPITGEGAAVRPPAELRGSSGLHAGPCAGPRPASEPPGLWAAEVVPECASGADPRLGAPMRM